MESLFKTRKIEKGYNLRMYFPLKSLYWIGKNRYVEERNDLFKEVREWLDQQNVPKSTGGWMLLERCYTDTLIIRLKFFRRRFNSVNRTSQLWLRDPTAQLRPIFMWLKRPCFMPDHCWFGQTPGWPWFSKISWRQTPSILRESRLPRNRPHRFDGWIWERKAEVDSALLSLLCWLISCGRKLVRLANLMKPWSQRPRKSSISDSELETIITHHIASFVIPTGKEDTLAAARKTNQDSPA